MTEPIAAEEEGSAPVRAPRDSLFLHARIHPIDGGPDIQVRVRNLSSGGMMAEPSVEVAPGERVMVDLRGVGEIAATVMWTVAGRAGLAFDREIDPRKARTPIGESARVNRPIFTPQARRPGLKIL